MLMRPPLLLAIIYTPRSTTLETTFATVGIAAPSLVAAADAAAAPPAAAAAVVQRLLLPLQHKG